MACKVVIAESFRLAAGGLEEVESEGKTIAECLEAAAGKAPALRKLWFTPEGGLSKYVILTLNGENVPIQELGRPVKSGDEIYPILLIGGG
jgi:molybdopterin converting factor small subunit